MDARSHSQASASVPSENTTIPSKNTTADALFALPARAALSPKTNSVEPLFALPPRAAVPPKTGPVEPLFALPPRAAVPPKTGPVEPLFALPPRAAVPPKTGPVEPLFALPPRAAVPPNTHPSEPLFALPPRAAVPSLTPSADALFSVPPRTGGDRPKRKWEEDCAPALPQRHTWDKAHIDQLARSSETYEVQFGSQLQRWLGPEYVVQPHSHKFRRHDFLISRTADPARKIGIELECGVTQEQWLQRLTDNRRRWVQGLNVVSRKIVEGQHFDIFIKHNKACNSFFAATYAFIKQHGRVLTQTRNSLSFQTDNTIYALPWSLVDQEQQGQHVPEFVSDDTARLKALVDRCLATPPTLSSST